MGRIQEDCYYYIEPLPGVPMDDLEIKAMCIECARKRESRSGLMWWPGSRLGYNENFDLECTVPGCGRKIFARDTATSEDNEVTQTGD